MERKGEHAGLAKGDGELKEAYFVGAVEAHFEMDYMYAGTTVCVNKQKPTDSEMVRETVESARALRAGALALTRALQRAARA